MPTFCARGVNHSEVKDFTHDQLQDLVGTISLKLSHGMTARANINGYLEPLLTG